MKSARIQKTSEGKLKKRRIRYKAHGVTDLVLRDTTMPYSVSTPKRAAADIIEKFLEEEKWQQ